MTKVVPNGFFVDIAAFTAFVSAHVRFSVNMLFHASPAYTPKSMPTNMKYDGNATPPSFVEHTDQGPVEVTPMSQVRVRLSGIRAEVGQMWAVATINDVSFLLGRSNGISADMMLFTGLLGVCLSGFNVLRLLIYSKPAARRRRSVVSMRQAERRTA